MGIARVEEEEAQKFTKDDLKIYFKWGEFRRIDSFKLELIHPSEFASWIYYPRGRNETYPFNTIRIYDLGDDGARYRIDYGISKYNYS